jgi:hypothetical protein
MKIAKQFRKQAIAAERVATQTADSFVVEEMRNLALAFRAQAEISKRGRGRGKSDPVTEESQKVRAPLSSAYLAQLAGTSCAGAP